MSTQQDLPPDPLDAGQEKSANTGGRPTLYRSEYADQAQKYCLLGATNEDLAQFFDVSVTTIKNWMRDHEEFLAAIKNGKEIADARVAESLFKRANGFVAPDTHFAVINGEVVETPTEKVYPPDTTACIFWLKNRQPGKWRDKVEIKQETEHTFPDMSESNKRYDEFWRQKEEERRRFKARFSGQPDGESLSDDGE